MGFFKEEKEEEVKNLITLNLYKFRYSLIFNSFRNMAVEMSIVL